MKLVKLYEDMAREDRTNSCMVKFGNKLFDPQLSNSGDIETNTKTEVEYLKLISQFTSDKHGKDLNPKFIEAIKTLKSCISYYPEVLQSDGTAYRGTVLTLSDLLGQYSDIADDLKDGGVFDFTYKPKSLIQSWTTDKEAAEEFAEFSPQLMRLIRDYKLIKNDSKALVNFIKQLYDDLDNITVPVLIKLDTSNDFLFKSKYFMVLSQHDYEEELLRINNQPTRVSGEIIEFFFPHVFGILTTIKKYEANLKK